MFLSYYIHLKPVRAGLIPVARLQHYPHSSFHQLWNPRRRWSFVQYATCLQTSGGFRDSPDGRIQYSNFLKQLSLDVSEQKKMGFGQSSNNHG